jgi:hypothetical protein
LLATPAGFEPATFSLEEWQEIQSFQTTLRQPQLVNPPECCCFCNVIGPALDCIRGWKSGMDWSATPFDVLLRLWDRGKTLLWALAAICAAVFGLLLVGSYVGMAGSSAVLSDQGLWLVLGAMIFGILAAVRTIEERSPPTVRLIANERQSLWAQAKQADGRITTQFSFRMQVTNLTDKPIRLSAVRLTRPWTRARVLDQPLFTRHPDPAENIYGDYPILPRAVSSASCTIILDQPVGRAGKTIAAVIKVSDQFGRWHKLKFKRLVDPTRPMANVRR